MSRLLAFLWVFYNSGLLSVATVTEGPVDVISCVNDYLFTITCTVRISKGSDHTRNISYWLEFQDYSGKIFNCSLVRNLDNYQCAFQSPERFTDAEKFVVKLWDNLQNGRMLLENNYKPVQHIKPVAPCNLSIRWFSGGYNFTWHSGYQNIQPRVLLIKQLKYRLWYYRSGDPDDVVEKNIVGNLLQVEDVWFEPNTEYIAQVSSSPNQAHYHGEWSNWSPAVKWRTNKQQGALLMAGLAACVAIGIMLFLCFSLKARLNIKKYFIVPTPEPFFQSLYKKCKGDFKSWVRSQENLEGPLNMEEALKLDTLVVTNPLDHKESYILPPPHHTQTNATYVNPCVKSCGVDPQDTWLSIPFLVPEFTVIVGTVLLKETDPSKGDSRSGDLQCSTGYSNSYCTLTATSNELIPSNAPEEDRDSTP